MSGRITSRKNTELSQFLSPLKMIEFDRSSQVIIIHYLSDLSGKKEINKMEECFDKNIWVLSNYRSGSIFLCKFLETSGNYPEGTFSEKFNPNRPDTLKKYYTDTFFNSAYRKWENGDLETRRKLFFKHVIKKQLLPDRMKFMREQFLDTCGLVDGDKPLIESLLPGIKYIFLKRNDVYSIAVSNYIALQTGKWVLKPEEKQQYSKTPILYDEAKLLALYKKCYYYVQENNWDLFLGAEAHFYIEFEKLVNDPFDTFSSLLKFLDIPPELVDVEKYVKSYQFIPTIRPETEELVGKLKQILEADKASQT